MKKHYLLVILGIPAWDRFISCVVYPFRYFGITPLVENICWTSKNTTFDQKQEVLMQRIDALSNKEVVSLLGISAGGSAVINVFSLKKEKIQRVVTLCSRFTDNCGQLSSGMKKCEAYRDSIKRVQETEQSLSKNDKKKILTIKALYDEKVPSSVSSLSHIRAITLCHPFIMLQAFSLV
jgi:hypothetical protein